MAKPAEVKAHILRDVKLAGWQEKIVGRWSYGDLAADPDWFHGWISFDTVSYHPGDRAIYCGLNSFDGDLLYRFDLKAATFECLHTKQWTDAYDVKIHRTLLHNPADGCLYFATSMLHDMDRQQKAGGGKLVRYDPSTAKYDVLGVPAERLYIQSIAADWDRGQVYSFTYPAEAVYRTDLASRESRLVAYVGNAIMFAQPHNAVVDRDGWLWGTWAETRAWDEATGTDPVRLFKYHPDGDSLVFFEHGLSRWADERHLLANPAATGEVTSALGETRHRQDFGFCDSMAYDGGRYIYAGTVAGVLCRIDVESGKVEKLANAITSGRFPAMALSGGVLYGAGGMHGRTQIVRWKMDGDRIETFSDLEDPAIGDRPARIHELAVDHDHRLYLAENDNHVRSSYLWSVALD
jgi:sugar lactone lactonase YvrE